MVLGNLLSVPFITESLPKGTNQIKHKFILVKYKKKKNTIGQNILKLGIHILNWGYYTQLGVGNFFLMAPLSIQRSPIPKSVYNSILNSIWPFFYWKKCVSQLIFSALFPRWFRSVCRPFWNMWHSTISYDIYLHFGWCGRLMDLI